MTALLLALLFGQVEVANTRANSRAVAVRCVNTAGTAFESCAGGGAAGGASTQGVGIDGGQTWAVSGNVGVTNFPATQPVSGTLTCNAGTGTLAVSGSFFQATQPVSLASAPTTAVTGPLTDTQLRATPVPVSGTVTASGPVTDTQLRASAVNVSLGNSTGKALAMKTGTLASSAATADQVVLTYTVTAGKTLYLQYASINVRLTTFAATATFFGNCSLESPAGTKLFTKVNAGSGVGDSEYLPLGEPLPIAAGVVVRWVCTPSAVTAMTWVGNFGGYEK